MNKHEYKHEHKRKSKLSNEERKRAIIAARSDVDSCQRDRNFSQEIDSPKLSNLTAAVKYCAKTGEKLKTRSNPSCIPFSAALMLFSFALEVRSKGFYDILIMGQPATEVVPVSMLLDNMNFHLMGGKGKWDGRLKSARAKNVFHYTGSLEENKKKIEKKCGFWEYDAGIFGGRKKFANFGLWYNCRFPGRMQTTVKSDYLEIENKCIKTLNPSMVCRRFYTSYIRKTTLVLDGVVKKAPYAFQTGTVSFIKSHAMSQNTFLDSAVYNGYMFGENCKIFDSDGEYNKRVTRSILINEVDHYNKIVPIEERIDMCDVIRIFKIVLQ